MSKYELILRNEKVKQYSRIALYIILINLFIFLYISFSTPDQHTRIATISGAAIIIILLGIELFLERTKQNEQSMYKPLAEMVISLLWLDLGVWWAAILIAILGILFLFSRRILRVSVTANEIQYPSFPGKRFSWNSLTNIILKDGMLTIDTNDNKLLQQHIDDKNTVVNEKEFNDFCSAQLKR